MAHRLLSAGLALAAALLAPPALAAPGPALLLDATECDLGTVAQGERPSCSFSFRNAGDAELAIFEVEPSCGCTTTLLSAPLLPPGASGALSATFDSGTFAGPVAKEIALRSNDPARPEVTLTLRALVEPEVDFEPREVVFPAPAPGTAARALVVLVNRRAGPVIVRSIAAEPSSFSCRIPSWPPGEPALRVESWDRVPIEIVEAPVARAVMPVAGRCTLEIEGARKREFVLKILSLP